MNNINHPVRGKKHKMKIFSQFEIINRLNECLCTLKKVKYPTVKD